MKPGIRRLIASALIISFISLPEVLLAQGRRGGNLVVNRKDGSNVRGELIAVKEGSLLLLSPVGVDESVGLSEISTIKIAGKSQAGTGFLVGFLLGAIGGGALGSQDKDPIVGRAGVTFLGGLLIGSLTGLVGLGIGALAGADETIAFEGLSEAQAGKVLLRLRGMARMRGAA